MLLEDFGDVLLDVGQVGFAVLIDAHIVECRYELHLHAEFEQVVGHHVGAHQLALCQDFLFELRSVAACREVVQVEEDAAQQFAGLFGQ